MAPNRPISTAAWTCWLVLLLAAALPGAATARPGAPEGGALSRLAGIAPAAPSGPISTGRPSFSIGPGTTTRGWLQVEGGYGFGRDEGADSHALGNLTLKAGVGDSTELRLSWGGLAGSEDAEGEIDFRRADVTLGIKQALPMPEGSLLSLGVLGQVSVPAGEDEASSGSVDPAAALLWARDLHGPAGLFGTLIATSLTDGNDDRSLQAGGSAGVSLPIRGSVSSYLEYYGIFRVDGGLGPEHNLGTGLLWTVTDDFQLDANARVGLNDRAGDFGLDAGFGVRF